MKAQRGKNPKSTQKKKNIEGAKPNRPGFGTVEIPERKATIKEQTGPQKPILFQVNRLDQAFRKRRVMEGKGGMREPDMRILREGAGKPLRPCWAMESGRRKGFLKKASLSATKLSREFRKERTATHSLL